MPARRLVLAIAWILAVPAAPCVGRPLRRGAPPSILAAPPPALFRRPPAPFFTAPAAQMWAAAQRVAAIGRMGAVGVIGVPTRSAYDRLIEEIADRYDLEHALVKAVVRAESNFDPGAVSPKGALGLMQLMPETAARRRVRNPLAPRDNLDGGCRELRFLLDRYAGNLPLALAAYNAGVERVEQAGGVPAIAETREYLVRVLGYRAAYRNATQDVSGRRL